MENVDAITNLTINTNFDDFDDKLEDVKIHISVKQRNGKKCFTVIEGIPDTYDYKKIAKDMRHKFHCGVSVYTDETNAKMLQLNGDHRSDIKQLIMSTLSIDESNIVVHGF